MFNLSVWQIKLLAIIWLVIISVLFLLPGSALPQQALLSFIEMDKVIHVVFFALLVYLWHFYFPLNKWNLLLFVFACLYGVTIEFIQHFFVFGRSFAVGDIVADMTGALSGIWFWKKTNKKLSSRL